MTVAKHIPEDDLALFALALMQPEEAALTMAHLKHCDLCRSEVTRMQGDLVVYAMTAEMQEPPAEARDRLLRAVAKEKKFIPPAEPVLTARHHDLLDRPERYDTSAKRGIGAFGWAGWAIAAGLAALVGWQFYLSADLQHQLATQSAALALEHAHPLEGQTAEAVRAQEVLRTLTDPAAMQVALHLPATAGATPKPEGHAAYNAAKGDLVFVASHLRPVAPGKTYELWLLPAKAGGSAVPAGLFRPDANGNASVVLPILPKNVAAKGFGVTVEDEGGSSAPTPPIVLAGT